MSRIRTTYSIGRLLVHVALIVGALFAFDAPASAYSGWELKNHWYWPTCLDMDIGAGAPNGAKVQLWTCNGWENQGWVWVDVGGGWGQLRSVKNGKCLDLNIAGSVGNGSKVQVWDCLPGNTNQHWRAETSPGDSNAYRLVNRRYGCLDADWNGSYYDGKKLQIWSCGWTDNQIWTAYLH